jgi:Rab GDP dissociation inhibitor
MSSGKLVSLLLHLHTDRYLQFQKVEGSFVYKNGEVQKVPATDSEALKSPLMGFMEKRRCRKFFMFTQDYDATKPDTHQGKDLKRISALQLFNEFSLSPDTIDFIGHAMALFLDDDYLKGPAEHLVERVQLYAESLARYGTSPYLYPLYGLGELPQAFARLCAVCGGTYMLNKPIESVTYDEATKTHIVRSEGEDVRTKMIIADPTYFPDRVKKVGQVIRCICIITHPISNTGDVNSVQIIIPQKQVNRKNDIYVAMVSSTHQVASKGHYLAIISTTCETSNPMAEIEPALKLLNPIVEKFMWVSDLFEPLDDGKESGIFISRSYDATSHFESSCYDILDIYHRATGVEFDFSKVNRGGEEDEQPDAI